MGTTTMTNLPFLLVVVLSISCCFLTFHVHGENLDHHNNLMRKMQAFRTSIAQRDSLPPSPSGAPSPRVYHVTSYGADPNGKEDSTDAIIRAITDALQGQSDGFLFDGIRNLGGARVDLDGGSYVITRPLQFPVAGRGNLVIHGGTLKASDDFPADGYLIDLSAPAGNTTLAYNFEFITLRDLLVNSNFKGGGIQVVNSLRIAIDNCYITHFSTNGILVKGGHETYIRNSFLGQHITAGNDPGERNFSGTAINLMGNDNAVTDVVIFSANVGIMVSGQANILSGVHCYNKATGFGGTGIYIKAPGLTQTRIVNSYMDYTGIVVEDPVQLHISSSFFLGDAFILFKSINGVVNGVNVVDNMFSGGGKGVDIVQLDETNAPFKKIDQVMVDRNNVNGMNLKSTIARGNVQGNGSTWTVDLNSILLFPNFIKYVQYTFNPTGDSFANHALRNVSNNKVVVQSDVQVPASVFVMVDQGKAY